MKLNDHFLIWSKIDLNELGIVVKDRNEDQYVRKIQD